MPDERTCVAAVEKSLAHSILQSYFNELVASGHIDPRGKSDDELRQELAKYVHYLEKQTTVYASLDYSRDLLVEARTFADREKHEMACLFYATWFEHWINNLIATYSRGRYLSIENAKILIRETGLKAKYLCLPSLLDLPSLAKQHTDTVFRIAELRNAFVHFKFTPQDIDVLGTERDTWSRNFEMAEKATRYLQNYERKHLYKGQKKRAKQLTRNPIGA